MKQKKLGVPMSAPFFQFKAFFKSNNIHIRSSNYELYGDLSARVMTTLGSMCPELEIYSIDEAFLQLDSFEHFGIFDYSVKIKKQVKQWTGIPVSIGIAPTKTLSKIANHIAKKETTLGVFDLRDEQEREKILARFPVEDIWGIGRKLSKKLTDIGIHTAKDLRDSDPKSLRKVYSVLLERMIYELRGEACIQLEEMQPKKQIMSSRSFGRPVTNKIELEQAVAHHVTKAAGKLRRQNCRASGLYFFLHTNPYKLNSKQYANSISYRFPEHTNDTGLMIENAMACLNHLYKAGYEYHKCGVMLLDLVPNKILQQDLFLQDQQASTSRRKCSWKHWIRLTLNLVAVPYALALKDLIISGLCERITSRHGTRLELMKSTKFSVNKSC
jgi:DNA polymerase V